MTDIHKHQAELMQLKDEYEHRIKKITDHIHHPQDELNQHWDDQAIATTENDMRKSLLLEAEHGLNLVNGALNRIEHGTYGVCLTCGEEIEEGRLQAVPYASECMQHAR